MKDLTTKLVLSEDNNSSFKESMRELIDKIWNFDLKSSGYHYPRRSENL
jgi:hypothetical protein